MLLALGDVAAILGLIMIQAALFTGKLGIVVGCLLAMDLAARDVRVRVCLFILPPEVKNHSGANAGTSYPTKRT